MTPIDELAELRQQVDNLTSYLTRMADICEMRSNECDELRRLVEAIPEGCTPADARVLREANHALAAENDELRARVAELEKPNHYQRDDSCGESMQEFVDEFCDYEGIDDGEEHTVHVDAYRKLPVIEIVVWTENGGRTAKWRYANQIEGGE